MHQASETSRASYVFSGVLFLRTYKTLLVSMKISISLNGTIFSLLAKVLAVSKYYLWRKKSSITLFNFVSKYSCNVFWSVIYWETLLMCKSLCSNWLINLSSISHIFMYSCFIVSTYSINWSIPLILASDLSLLDFFNFLADWNMLLSSFSIKRLFNLNVEIILSWAAMKKLISIEPRCS